MDLYTYFNLVKEIAEELSEHSGGIWDELERQYRIVGSKVRMAADFRRSILDKSDYDAAKGYLPIGYFTGWDELTRIVLFTMVLEIGKELQYIGSLKLCVKYNQQHPIFVAKPELWGYIRQKHDDGQDLELLSMRPFQQFMDTELLEYDGLYFETTAYLPPSILSWTRKEFPDASVYVRVNPYRHKTERIFRLDCEMLTPPSPNWWANTKVYPNQKDGFSFFLEDKGCSRETAENFWEYNIKGLRRLEGVVKRTNSGNMSIMMEEISKRDTDGYTVGRMIHLDTDAKPGTDARECQLNHLDLAINYYYADNEKRRMSESLAGGVKVADASHRIHLLRVENIPLTTLFAYVDQFFHSKIMKAEWRAAISK